MISRSKKDLPVPVESRPRGTRQRCRVSFAFLSLSTTTARPMTDVRKLSLPADPVKKTNACRDEDNQAKSARARGPVASRSNIDSPDFPSRTICLTAFCCSLSSIFTAGTTSSTVGGAMTALTGEEGGGGVFETDGEKPKRNHQLVSSSSPPLRISALPAFQTHSISFNLLLHLPLPSRNRLLARLKHRRRRSGREGSRTMDSITVEDVSKATCFCWWGHGRSGMG